MHYVPKRELSLEGMSVFQRCGVEKIIKIHEYSANGIHFYYIIHFERMFFSVIVHSTCRVVSGTL